MSIIVLKKSAFNKENTTGKNVSLSLWRVGKKMKNACKNVGRHSSTEDTTVMT